MQPSGSSLSLPGPLCHSRHRWPGAFIHIMSRSACLVTNRAHHVTIGVPELVRLLPQNDTPGAKTITSRCSSARVHISANTSRCMWKNFITLKGASQRHRSSGSSTLLIVCAFEAATLELHQSDCTACRQPTSHPRVSVVCSKRWSCASCPVCEGEAAVRQGSTLTTK